MKEFAQTVWRESGLEMRELIPPKNMDELLIMLRQMPRYGEFYTLEEFEKEQDELREELGKEHDETVEGLQAEIDELKTENSKLEDEATQADSEATEARMELAELKAELADVKGLARAATETQAEYIKKLEEANKKLTEALRDALFAAISDDE